MIDKPKGKVERMLDCFLRTREVAFKEESNSNLKMIPAKGEKCSHPKLRKLVTAFVCLAICGIVIVGYAMPRTVTVNVDNSITTMSTTYETTAKDVGSFIESHKIDYVAEEDLIDMKMETDISDGMVITIRKAFDLSVNVDGETLSCHSFPGETVEECLNGLNIPLGKEDIIDQPLDKKLKKDDVISITRVKYKTMVKKATKDFKVKTVADHSLQIGDVKVTQKGQKGETRKIYKIKYVDGVETEKTLIKTQVKKKVKDEIVSYGTKITSGKPSKYLKKISEVKAFSYYMPGNPHGAYGGRCEYGTCAVDRRLIELGSLLYIEGYGYAVANDVGGGIKGKTVDLYMEKGIQCNIWGARTVNVYVIRNGPA